MRARSSTETLSGRLEALDTVIGVTPTRSAMVASVGRRGGPMREGYRLADLTLFHRRRQRIPVLGQRLRGRAGALPRYERAALGGLGDGHHQVHHVQAQLAAGPVRAVLPDRPRHV